MKAAVLHGKENIQIEEIPLTPLRPGEVRIRIHAALTCGTDLKVYRRGYHAKMIKPPAVFGHELAGEIVEVAQGVERFAPGDRVVPANSAPCGNCTYCRSEQENLCDDLLFLNGAYAQFIQVPERIVRKNLLSIPDNVSYAAAALTEPLACVVQGFNDLKPNRSERCLVIGAGPIGLFFVALAAHAGVEVIVAGKGETRLKTATALGAAKVIDIASTPDWETEAQANGLLDLVFEAVGKPETWQTALRLVRKGGRINFFGGCPSGTSISLDTGLMHYSSLQLLASFHHTPRTIRQALEYISKGVIPEREFVNGSVALDDLPGLFQSMVAGNSAVKTLVKVQ
jgi:L-iditol 2-dehydrogenase